jgi:phosphoenolpyruvate carboxylase
MSAAPVLSDPLPSDSLPSDLSEKDLPLRDDIRLLGRVLGDTVREQQGESIFAIVEYIRQTSIRFRRDEDDAARRELEAILNGLSRNDAIQLIRAFGFFSHLANIAEDLHHIRRTRAHACGLDAPREGSLAHALDRAREAGLSAAQIRAFFDTALIVPVLTAHPTEVRRKSTIEREMEVARLLAEYNGTELTPDERQGIEEALRRAILTLWQTNLLRQARLRVIDEVANALSYYDYTFLGEVPRLYAALEDRLRADDGEGAVLASFLRLGSWIGGDRDGNPFVTDEVLRRALAMQSGRLLRFYLDELDHLGGELSLDSRLVGVSEQLQELADRSSGAAAYQRYEPYRRAITGMCAQLAATARAFRRERAKSLQATYGRSCPLFGHCPSPVQRSQKGGFPSLDGTRTNGEVARTAVVHRVESNRLPAASQDRQMATLAKPCTLNNRHWA